MPRQGRFLEILVQHLQEFLAHDGIIVRSPEEFYKNGKKIGEIDVTLRGKFGSSEIFVGIECRDRPGKGPQDIGWIREIRGKQEQFQVNKMIAVSSTGFTEPAMELAQNFGIDLLTVDDIDAVRPSDWFKSITFIVRYYSKTPLAIYPPELIPQVSSNISKPILRLPNNSQLIYIPQYFD